MLANVINPEVMAPMIDAKIEAQLKLTPYATVDTTLEGTAGNTLTIPAWGYVGDAKDVAEDEECSVEAMTSTSNTFTIKKAMKTIGLTEEARLSGYGDPVGQAEKQLAKSVASKVDADVIACAYTGTMTYQDSTLSAISYNGLVGAVTKFEDEEDGVEKVLFIHPLQEETLLKDANFTSADKFVGGVAVNGSIGKVAGAWVKKSKRVRHIEFSKDNASGTITIVADTTDESSTEKHLDTIQPKCLEKLVVGDKVKGIASGSQYYANPILKMQSDSDDTESELPAITILLKKETSLDHEWLPKRQRHELTVAKYYGVAKTNDAKIVVAKFK